MNRLARNVRCSLLRVPQIAVVVTTSLFGFSTACLVSTGFGGTEFQCPDGVTCPEGQVCVDFVCTVDAPEPGVVDFIDDEDLDFEQGQFTDVQYSGDRLGLLAESRSGRFISRVFDGETTQAKWTRLEWRPVARYRAPLPAQRAIESGYAEGNASMAENLLLLQFDDAPQVASGETISDRSGQGNNALAFADAPIEVTEGVSGGALVDVTSSRLEIPAVGVADLQLGESDFTWAVWVKTNSTCVGPTSDSNQAYIGIEDDAGEVPKAHLWLGCRRAASCPSAAPDGSAGGTLCSDQTAANRDCVSYCGTSGITDDQWHQLVVRKVGHSSAAVTLFVDGVVEAEESAAFVAPIGFDAFGLGVGHFSVIANRGGNDDATGTLDEVAIWSRALSDSEIADNYRRGAARLQFRVRTCEQADCSDEPAFVGPDASFASAFTDPGTGTGTVSFDLTDGPTSGATTGRYFQYEIRLATLRAGIGPALFEVRTSVLIE